MKQPLRHAMNPETSQPPRSPLRFWCGLWIWSVLLAAGLMYFSDPNTLPYSGEVTTFDVMGGYVFPFLISTVVVFLLSYVLIRIWRHRPRRMKTWFWLALGSVVTASLWIILLIHHDVLPVDDMYGVNLAKVLSLWAMFFLCLVVLLYSYRHFFRWLFSWRILKRWLLVGGSLTALVLLFYAVEDWRGRRAWESCRQELVAKGEQMDFKDFIPPPVPADQNFALAPIVVSSYAALFDTNGNRYFPTRTNIVNRLELQIERKNYSFPTNVVVGSWQKAKLTDLKPWQEYYRATAVTNLYGMPGEINQPDSNSSKPDITPLATNEFSITAQPQTPAADVLLALSRYDAAIAEIRQAAARSSARFPLNYQATNMFEVLLPHLASLKRVAIVLQLRAIAELQAGQTDKALADVKLILRLGDSVRSEPFVISHLLRVALVLMAIEPVWEGLAEHRWSPTELTMLSQEFEKLYLTSELQFVLRAERIENLEVIDYYKKSQDRYWSNEEDVNASLIYSISPNLFEKIGELFNNWPRLPEPINQLMTAGWNVLTARWVENAAMHLPPAGWYDFNKAAIAKTFQEQLLPAVKPEKHLIDWQTVTVFESLLSKNRQESKFTPHDALIYILLSPMNTSIRRFASAQNGVDMAVAAIALEQHRLARGNYPEALTELTPQFLAVIPPDVVNGKPLHYRRTDDGRFILYSIGWNGNDDGGIAGMTEYGSFKPDIGDWVWQYSAQP